ncbi:hypothetical protein BGZ47_003253, partial [Haplosporangium gracile]
DQGWGRDDSVKIWMLIIINTVETTSDDAVNKHGFAMLQELDLDNAPKIQHPYSQRCHLSIPDPSPILAKVQKIPYMEYELYNLRLQRLKDSSLSILIPPGHYSRLGIDLFQGAVIAPFSIEQIQDYVEQYVPLGSRTWCTEEYMDKLTTIPNLMDLVKNPFLLSLALEALPAAIKGKQDLSTIKIFRVQLHDTFVEHWSNVTKWRLQSNALSAKDRAAFDELLDAGFVSTSFDYSTRLAMATFDSLFQRDLLAEPSVIQFLSDRAKESTWFKQHLLAVVKLSKSDSQASQLIFKAFAFQEQILLEGSSTQHNYKIPTLHVSTSAKRGSG